MDSRITGKNDKKNDEKVKIILYIGGIDYEKTQHENDICSFGGSSCCSKPCRLWRFWKSSEAAGGEAKEGGYKVAMISDTSVSDGGWGASCYQAMVDAAAEKGWETVYTDNVATSDYATVMTDYAELGYDLIFAPGNQYTDAVKQVAEEYPEIKFALLNGTVETDNIQSILPDAEQIGYMAGALAGLMSKTNNIGFIGGMELDTTKAKVECYEKQPRRSILTSRYLPLMQALSVILQRAKRSQHLW